MANTCNGLCELIKSTNISNSKKYEKGQKRCTLCSVFFKTTCLRCPCCKTKLRTKSRTKYRQKNIFSLDPLMF